MYAEYSFMFDPAETWEQLYEFEHMLDEFLETLGLEAEKVIPLSVSSKAIIYIKKKPVLESMKDIPYDPSTSKVKLKVKLPKE